MELFLNLLWLLIAAGAIGVWRTRWVREKPRSRRGSLLEWTAMGCALVLLFFAVSLTDDLHAEAMLLDECAASRRHSISSHHPQQAKRVAPECGPAILPQITKLDPPQLISSIIFVPLYPCHVFTPDLSCSRAPPTAVL
jgi:hypothetical protein